LNEEEPLPLDLNKALNLNKSSNKPKNANNNKDLETGNAASNNKPEQQL